MTSPQKGAPVLVFTATYNEADNIGEWYRRTRAVLPDAHLLVVDDKSPDGTGKILESLLHLDDRMEVIHRPAKVGLGSAHKIAFRRAIEGNYSLLVTMDSDLSHQPEEIPGLLHCLAGHDFVIGTRWGANGSCEYAGFRRMVSRAGNRAARLLIPTGLTEYTTSFRAFSRASLEAILADQPPDDGYAFFVETIFTLHERGLRLTEAPINFRDRSRGTSKIPRNQILVSTRSLIRLFLKKSRLRSMDSQDDGTQRSEV